MQRTKDKSLSAILVVVLVLVALTSTAWTKKLFGRGGRGTEEEISFSVPSLDQLVSLVGGQEHQVRAMIRGENISEFLTMAQNLDLPIDVRIECNRTFVKCTADVQGSRIEAFIWIRQNVQQETCRQILNDVDSSSTCREKMVRWTKAKATSRCCKTQSQRKYMRAHVDN